MNALVEYLVSNCKYNKNKQCQSNVHQDTTEGTT